ncbi:MAG TPA: UDP-galactose-4-epimerase [Flavobacteriales bacterium]|jgi:nucleoside-diphosphate-sugar epimerase|nr:UDP-galactose-4-epimerase [Flavobacteriales bacterium]
MSRNRVLFTGSSGFIGRIIIPKLPEHDIFTLGRSKSNTIRLDLATQIPSLDETNIVFHAAGKAHVVPKTRKDRNKFYDVNINGAVNLLKGLSSLHNPPELIINLSTVAVYGLNEGELIDEQQPINPNTPYGESKAKAEELFLEWGRQNGVAIVNARLPLVSGIDPPGNLGFMLKAIDKGKYFRIGSGRIRKSILWAGDLASLVGLRNTPSGNYNLTDGYHPEIREIEDWIGKQLNKNVRTLPVWFIKSAAQLGDIIPNFPLNNDRFKKLVSPLTFSSTRAEEMLGWNPRPVLTTKLIED